jgi:hypothetical protein
MMSKKMSQALALEGAYAMFNVLFPKYIVLCNQAKASSYHAGASMCPQPLLVSCT